MPGAHVAPLQQPPLQGVAAEQLVVHIPLTHALPSGQSAWVMQPHFPEMHADPAALDVQSTHADDDPHDVGDVPDAHMPVEPPQQKVAPHAPASQLDVHAPPMHVGVAPVQLTHAPPDEPQLARAVPVTQLVPSQHPPVHGRPPAQLVPHRPVLVSHASPLGQLPGVQEARVSPGASFEVSWRESRGASLPESRCLATSVVASFASSVASSIASGPPPSPPSVHSAEHVPVGSSEQAGVAARIAPNDRSHPRMSCVVRHPLILGILSLGRPGPSVFSRR